MQLYDWLHLLHVVSGFLVVVGLIALWTLVFGTRTGSALFDARSATTFGRVTGILVGVGMMGALVFGVWLAIDGDRYQLWDGWILASLVLWAFGGWAGGRAGREFERDPVAAACRDSPPGAQQCRGARHPRAHDLEARRVSVRS